jgi:hypothetical protein
VTYYVDASSASEAAPYDTWAKAAHSLATVLAIPPAFSDIIYCNANTGETIAAELDLASSGTNAGGYIKVIGCKPDGATGVTVDGTRYVITGNNNNINIVDLNGQDMWWFENIEVKNTGTTGTLHGFYCSTGASTGHVFVNCCANTIDTNGWQCDLISYSVFIRCVAYSCVDGFGGYGGSNLLFFCASRDNSADGFNLTGAQDTCIGCISHGNAIGFNEMPQRRGFLFNCVADSNSSKGMLAGAATTLYPGIMIGNRITNHTGAGDVGVDCASEVLVYGYNAFDTNTDHIANTLAAVTMPIPLENTVTDSNDYNNEDGAGGGDTNQGYAQAVANNNFATGYTDATDPDLRRSKITVPWS